MALNRSDLRLALTTGLTNGFATLSLMPPFGLYASLAVLAVCTGTYGNSRALGRQRLLGSILGMAILLVAYEGLKGVPFPLAIALALGALRLFGGLLGLQVGYKVGGMIVVMGWLVHDSQLGSWVPLRLGWTAFGILVSMVSLRLFWPARALADVHAGLRRLLADLALELEAAAALLEQPSRTEGAGRDRPAAALTPPPNPQGAAAAPAIARGVPALRRQLLTLRQQLPLAWIELGGDPSRHPRALLLRSLCETCSALLTALGGLERRTPPVHSSDDVLSGLQGGEAALLRSLAARLRDWQQQLRHEQAHPIPPPPPTAWQPPVRWQGLQAEWQVLPADAEQLRRLQRHASRLALCGLAQRAVENGERRWLALQQSRGV